MEAMQDVVSDWAAELSPELHVALIGEQALSKMRDALLKAGYRKSQSLSSTTPQEAKLQGVAGK